jgi:hypothetical protein
VFGTAQHEADTTAEPADHRHVAMIESRDLRGQFYTAVVIALGILSAVIAAGIALLAALLRPAGGA